MVLGYGYWQKRFGGNSSVLNQTIDREYHPMTVVVWCSAALGVLKSEAQPISSFQ